MAPYYENEIWMLISGLLGSIPTVTFSLASYVLTAWAVYTIAQRRGLRSPWMAWIPVVNCWLLGSISDQYRYVVRGEVRSKRKWLLGLKILTSVFSMVILGLVISMVGTAIFQNHFRPESLIGPLLSILGLCLPLAAGAIAFAVIRYMVLYDLYKSLDPDNSVMFLVLSIVFGITEPFFLFFNRNKDKGMPPRKADPTPEEPEQTTFWEYEAL